MGCGSSKNTAVQPLGIGETVNGSEDETGVKLDGRGDSAVSKGTTDSGVVMESGQITVLPGEVPRTLPPLTCVRESELSRMTRDGIRPKSSEILEELLDQGIIPVGQRGSTAGEAYSIMLDDGEGVRRRPPSRLESLKASKSQSHPSREKFEEKMRLAEMRRKSREDELKTRLRTKSARLRAPAPTFSPGLNEDVAITPVEHIEHPLTLDAQDPPIFSPVVREEAEGEENAREAVGDGRECREETGGAGGREWKEVAGEGGVRGSEDNGEEEQEEVESTQVEELKKGQLLMALGELENDSSFQQAEDKEAMF